MVACRPSMGLPPSWWIRSVEAAELPRKAGLKPVLRASPMVPMVSRITVPRITRSQPADFIFATWDEKSVAPRLYVVFSLNSRPRVLRAASPPLIIVRGLFGELQAQGLEGFLAAAHHCTWSFR